MTSKFFFTTSSTKMSPPRNATTPVEKPAMITKRTKHSRVNFNKFVLPNASSNKINNFNKLTISRHR